MKSMVATSTLALLVTASPALAQVSLTHVPEAQTKVANETRPNRLSPELGQEIVAQGSSRLENPSTLTRFYGYDDDGPMIGVPATVCTEAHKTEPDENTYLVFEDGGLKGPKADFNYGTRFLFQGHELGTGGYITRINLDIPSDADGSRRITKLATHDVNGNAIPLIDGSTWDPFLTNPSNPNVPGLLLFSAELGTNGGIVQADPGFAFATANANGTDNPGVAVEGISVVNNSCVLGKGGYEDIKVDLDGNVWIVEDVGGVRPAATPQARVPNSFLYRFIPNDISDLKQGGRLQALRVKDTSNNPIVFSSTDALTTGVKDLHTCGNVLNTDWLDLNSFMTAPACDANAAAKAAGATPFKRPENGEFQPGTKTTVLYFDETGDTDLRTQAAKPVAANNYGGLGAVLKLTILDSTTGSGTIEPFYIGDKDHTGFDNSAFLTPTQLVFVEDASDTVHGAAPAGRGRFDSAFMFDLGIDKKTKQPLHNYCEDDQPIRILAQGRDASATVDSSCSGSVGFPNDGDNELTGTIVSNGDPSAKGLQGVTKPKPFDGKWRFFYTQQHGDNVTYEVNLSDSVTLPKKGGSLPSE